MQNFNENYSEYEMFVVVRENTFFETLKRKRKRSQRHWILYKKFKVPKYIF